MSYRLDISADGIQVGSIDYGYEYPDRDDIFGECEFFAAQGESNPHGDECVVVWEIVEVKDGSEDTVASGTQCIEIPPDHEALIREAARAAGRDRHCGDDPDDHRWRGEGGCDTNPGVWSTGGTGMAFTHVCRNCGLRRVEITHGLQRNDGDADTVEYEFEADAKEIDDE